MTDQSKTHILETHRDLLVRNLILTEEFFQKLVETNVLAQCMVDDVKSCKKRDDANNKLTEFLLLRGVHHTASFVRILQETGHEIVGDYLASELGGFGVENRLSSKEIQEKLKFVQHLTAEDNRKLVRFIESKVAESVLQATFHTSSMEKQRTRVVKAQCDEQMAELKHQVLGQEAEKDELKQQVKELIEENEALEQKVTEMLKEREQEKKSFEKQVTTQQNFALAGNKEIIRMRERVQSFDNHVRSMNVKARCFFKPDEEDEIKQDPDNVRISLLEKNFDKIMSRINELDVIKENIRKEMARQTKTIIELLHAREISKPEDVLKRYLANQREGLFRASRQTLALSNNIHSILSDATPKSPQSLRENDANFSFENGNGKRSSVDKGRLDFDQLNKHLGILYSDVEHLKSLWRTKDHEILELQKENERLRIEVKVNLLGHMTDSKNKRNNLVHNHLAPMTMNVQNGNHVTDSSSADDATLFTTDGEENVSKTDQTVANICLPPILRGKTKSHVKVTNDNGELLEKRNKRSLDPLDNLRSPRPDSPDPRSLSRASTRSDSLLSKKSSLGTVQFPKEWNNVSQ